MNYLEMLKSTDILSNITNIDELLSSGNIRIANYGKGATIYNCGEACDTLDIILSGKLVSYSLADNGSTTSMFEFKQNNIVGANLLFADNGEYPLNIYSREDSIVAHINRTAIDILLYNHDFVIAFLKSMSMNAVGLNKKIDLFSRKTLRENLIDYFRQQSIIQGTDEITLPFSKRELADYMGVQRQSLFRELKRMKDDSTICIDGKKIKINKFDTF